MPTANAKGSIESEGSIGKASGRGASFGAFRSARILGLRCRHAPRYLENAIKPLILRASTALTFVRDWREPQPNSECEGGSLGLGTHRLH